MKREEAYWRSAGIEEGVASGIRWREYESRQGLSNHRIMGGRDIIIKPTQFAELSWLGVNLVRFGMGQTKDC